MPCHIKLVRSGARVALILDPGNVVLPLGAADARTGVVLASAPGAPRRWPWMLPDTACVRRQHQKHGASVIDTSRWRVVETTRVGIWPLALAVSTSTGRVWRTGTVGL